MDLVRRVEEACREAGSDRTLREGIVARVRAAVPFDGYLFAMVDPVTLVATSPLADVPMLSWQRLPETIGWRYLTTLNRVDELIGEPAASLLTATDWPEESLIWSNVLRDLGVVDMATVAFGDRYGAWGYLELWRTTGHFEPSELDLLTAIVPAVTAALRGAVARTFVDESEQLLPVGPAVIVLKNSLVVRSQTDAAATALLQLLPPGQPMAPIPAAAYNVGGALLAKEEQVAIGEPWSRVHLGGSRWVTVKASRLGKDIAVSIEPSTPAERMDLFARAHGLSARESEVLGLLGVGLDSKEIAGQLFISDHTVNDHVKSILAKTGARTRQQLISRASGASR